VIESVCTEFYVFITGVRKKRKHINKICLSKSLFHYSKYSYFVFQIVQIGRFKSQAMWRSWAAFSFDLISLFQTYENRIFEAFSHGSVVNDNYMFSFK
jgi:hypothetical protein